MSEEEQYQKWEDEIGAAITDSWESSETLAFRDGAERAWMARADIAAQQLAKMKEQRDRLLNLSKKMHEYVEAFDISDFFQKEIAAIESESDSPDGGKVICTNCNGMGDVKIVPDSGAPAWWMDCPECHGTGRRIE